jgi:hypothetical protein
MDALPPAVCDCACHVAIGAEGKPDLATDDIARETACPSCRAAHWKAWYLATEPVKPAPRKKKTVWIDREPERRARHVDGEEPPE